MRPLPALFVPLPQNYCSILDNPSLIFGTLLTAYPLNPAPKKVNPSKNYNHPDEH
jgi:hypothetical protein